MSPATQHHLPTNPSDHHQASSTERIGLSTDQRDTSTTYAMKNIVLKMPPSGIGTTLEECIEMANSIEDFPLIIRPAFTLDGTGGWIAYNEFEAICTSCLAASLTSQVLVEKSLLGWKEYELEVMRDLSDNVVIVCSIENIDPICVQSGDSITVAPAQTLTDKECQRLRDYSIAIILVLTVVVQMYSLLSIPLMERLW